MAFAFYCVFLFSLLSGFLLVVLPNPRVPTAKTKEQLGQYAYSLGVEAKYDRRKQMSQMDRRRLISYAGVSKWNELDVLYLHQQFKKGLDHDGA